MVFSIFLNKNVEVKEKIKWQNTFLMTLKWNVYDSDKSNSEITATPFNCLLICSPVLVIGTVSLQIPVRSPILIDFVLLNQPQKKQSPFQRLFLSLALFFGDTLGKICTHPPT